MQRKVGEMRCGDKSRREESVLSRLRFGHTSLNSTGKHETGRCECGQEETVEHVIMQCERYEEDRRQMRGKFRKEKVCFDIRDILQKNSLSSNSISFS